MSLKKVKKTNIKDVLKEWIVNFLKNKDVITKKIESVEDGKGCDVFIKYKDKDLYVFVIPFVKEIGPAIGSLAPDANINLVVLNTEDNLNVMIKEWEALVKFPKLSIYFVNPDSQLETKWVINPHIHNKWCDTESLKLGIKSMFDTVSPYGG